MTNTVQQELQQNIDNLKQLAANPHLNEYALLHLRVLMLEAQVELLELRSKK